MELHNLFEFHLGVVIPVVVVLRHLLALVKGPFELPFLLLHLLALVVVVT
jgi:hypothetical protein